MVLALALMLAGCGGDSTSPTGSASSSSGPAGAAVTDLSVVGCATDDPTGVGDLTGAWEGSDHGVYYIRQVGECVWWFGTEVEDIDLGVTGQRGFANVASGRISGAQIDLEWADVPLGNKVNGGGLTYAYDEANDTLTLTEQRGGGEPFGGTTLTRIEPPASPSASPSASASASP